MRRERGGYSSERGWALVSVLWVLSILAMLAAATQYLTLTSARAEKHTFEKAHVDAVLDAGIVRAVAGITDIRVDKRWHIDGRPERFDFDGEHLVVCVQDETGRIDLNAADGSLLRQLLRSAGLQSEDADRLTDAILDWRSSKTFSRLHGASDADYAKAGFAWRPRHGAFQTVDELRLVLGMTPELLKRIRPALTVWSKHPSLDPSVAPREALLAYFPNQPERVNQIMSDRAGSPDHPGVVTGLLAPGLSPAGRAIDVTVTLERGSQHFQREAVVAFTGGDDDPPLVQFWR